MAGVSAKTERKTDPNRPARRVLFPFLVSVLAWIPLEAYGQYHAKETEWPTYAADLASTRYRPFDQINAANFNDLEVAWHLKTDMFGTGPEDNLEGPTP